MFSIIYTVGLWFGVYGLGLQIEDAVGSVYGLGFMVYGCRSKLLGFFFNSLQLVYASDRKCLMTNIFFPENVI
jgi:hypothetical protein